jgi:hypothetical protein
MDDEGSGTVGVLGVLRALLTYPRIKSGQAEDTRDFYWYIAEEVGLPGVKLYLGLIKLKEGKGDAAVGCGWVC